MQKDEIYVVWKDKKYVPYNWNISVSYCPMGKIHFEVDSSVALSTDDVTNEVKGYEDLTRILNEALQQATSGKGKERHAGNKPFSEQPISRISEICGKGFPIGQAIKKAEEAITLLRLKGKAAGKAELLGAIVYLAAGILEIERSEEN